MQAVILASEQSYTAVFDLHAGSSTGHTKAMHYHMLVKCEDCELLPATCKGVKLSIAAQCLPHVKVFSLHDQEI